MRFASKIASIAVASVGLSGLGIAAASAAPAPQLAPHVYTAVSHLINRGDTGDANNYWANDTMIRTLKLVQVPDNIPGQYEYKATVVDQGTFKTNVNQLSPHSSAFPGVQTGHFAHNGTIYGGGSYTLYTNAPVNGNKPNLGVPFAEYGTPVSNSDETTGNWPVQAFPHNAMVSNSGINPWGWTYNANVLTGYHHVTTWHQVYTGNQWELVTVWRNGHKTVRWENVAQYKWVPSTRNVPQYQHEQYVDASAGETGNIAGL